MNVGIPPICAPVYAVPLNIFVLFASNIAVIEVVFRDFAV
jgi:hypothetical protein